ncbi:MAG: hypothetical protein ACXAC5_22235 [Promethearchaeota archaeon]
MSGDYANILGHCRVPRLRAFSTPISRAHRFVRDIIQIVGRSNTEGLYEVKILIICGPNFGTGYKVYYLHRIHHFLNELVEKQSLCCELLSYKRRLDLCDTYLKRYKILRLPTTRHLRAISTGRSLSLAKMDN